MKVVSTTIIGVTLLLSASVMASQNKDIFVDPVNSFIEGNGSIDQPFRSINDALNYAQKKYSNRRDREPYTLQLRKGIYTEVVSKNSIQGIAEKPVVIQAYQNEDVIFDGTIDISGGWKSEGNNIYSKHIGEDIWQVFIKENRQWQEKVNAR